jgi:Holliday junction DNA helicase RuvA
MIASIEGTVLIAADDHLVVSVGGVGFKVYVTSSLKSTRVGDTVRLHTHLVVREDLLALYGFETQPERDFFLLLLGVNGVGPRIALAILSTLSVDAVRRAVLSEQSEMFARVPGVGKKTAQKILLHLQGKVSGGDVMGEILQVSDVDAEVLDALTGLGYSVIEAQAALQSIPRDAPKDVETRLRFALQYFSS